MITLRGRIGLLAVLPALAAGCGDDLVTPDDPVPADSTLPALQLVSAGLARPLFLITAPGDSSRLFVVEQGGAVRVIRDDSLLPEAFFDLTGLVSQGGEQGLLGMAFDTAWRANGRFYLSFTNPDGHTRIVRYTGTPGADVANPVSADTILALDQPFANHNGGMIAFGPDGLLYIGLGDGGSGGDPLNAGQDRTTLLGKMLRVDVSGAGGYAIPPGNPFAGSTGTRPEIWAYGLRNPWRFSFDRATGDLYIADVGQGDYEEINFEAPGNPGRNYGWRLMEGTHCFVAGCSAAGLTLPVLDYSHADGCSVTGGYVYRGSAVPRLRGHYFYSDYCSGFIRSARLQNGGVAESVDWSSRLAPGGLISSFGQDQRGELYILDHGGRVYRIIRSPALP